MYQSWFQNNSVVSSWLLNSISKYPVANIIYSSTATEMWKILKDQFHQPNGPRIFQLRRDLVSCTQGDLSVSGYFPKIQALWKELQEVHPDSTCSCTTCSCKDKSQKELVLTFLMGLTESFSSIHGQILLMDPIPNTNKVYAMVLQEAKQQEIGNAQSAIVSQPMACAVRSNEHRHKGNTKRERPLCTHCGLLGHIAEKCFKLHGYPPGYNEELTTFGHTCCKSCQHSCSPIPADDVILATTNGIC